MFQRTSFLGYIVGQGHVKPDPNKVAAIQDFPVPISQKQVRRFLGVCVWYRRFIRGFASVATPLTNTLKKRNTFLMSPEAVNSFEALKTALISAPLLSNPDFSKPFVIQCDASSNGIGGVLFQYDEENNEKPIAYFSEKLNDCQQKYSVTEQECYAAVRAVSKFRHYIEGTAFTIITDHASLKWLMGLKDLSGRLARWSLKLQAFTFQIEHRKGSRNVVPDVLSRVHLEQISLRSNDLIMVDLRSPEFQSKEYLDLIATVIKNQKTLPDIKVDNQFDYKRMFPIESHSIAREHQWKLWKIQIRLFNKHIIHPVAHTEALEKL